MKTTISEDGELLFDSDEIAGRLAEALRPLYEELRAQSANRRSALRLVRPDYEQAHDVDPTDPAGPHYEALGLIAAAMPLATTLLRGA